MSRRIFPFVITGPGILMLIGYVMGGLLGLTIGVAVSLFIIIELVYHYGAMGSLSHSFRSNTSSDVPNTQISKNIQSPRGFYDLDYRGRGKN